MWTNNRRFGEVLSRDRRERAAAGKLTRCRLFGQVTRSAFFSTDPLNGAQPILNECFGLYSLFLLSWKRPYA